MTTPRLDLPELSGSQASKHVTVNQALQRLDGIVQCAVINMITTAPPGSPSDGDSYVIAATATGAWAGKEGQIAIYDGGWIYVVPEEGFSIFNKASDVTYGYTGSVWSLRTTVEGIPRLAVANAFTDVQSISTAVAPIYALTLECTDAGANPGGGILLFRNSASATGPDIMNQITFRGKDSVGANTTYVNITSNIVDAIDGTEDGNLIVFCMVAGTLTQQTKFGDGILLGAATGGLKGTGTLNGTAVYDDDVLLTCAGAAKEFVKTGKIDLAKWDAMVPDRVIPARSWTEPVYEEFEEPAITRDRDGTFRVGKIKRQRQKTRRWPVIDGAGNRIMQLPDGAEKPIPLTIEVPVEITITEPERREKRQHTGVRILQKMIDEGFDPRKAEQYFDRLAKDEAIPGLPTQKEWVHNGFSIGDWLCRVQVAFECLTLMVRDLHLRVRALEAKVGV